MSPGNSRRRTTQDSAPHTGPVRPARLAPENALAQRHHAWSVDAGRGAKTSCDPHHRVLYSSIRDGPPKIPVAHPAAHGWVCDHADRLGSRQVRRRPGQEVRASEAWATVQPLPAAQAARGFHQRLRRLHLGTVGEHRKTLQADLYTHHGAFQGLWIIALLHCKGYIPAVRLAADRRGENAATQLPGLFGAIPPMRGSVTDPGWTLMLPVSLKASRRPCLRRKRGNPTRRPRPCPWRALPTWATTFATRMVANRAT